jgi:hypothetical protein
MRKPRQPRALVGNASDAEQVKRAGQTEKLRRDQQIADQFAVLSTRAGRAEYWRRMDECGVFKQSMHDSATWTAFNEGRRSVGLHMLAEVTSRFPDLYLVMQQEATQLEQQTDATVGETKQSTVTEDTDA